MKVRFLVFVSFAPLVFSGLTACQAPPVRNTTRGVLEVCVEGDSQPPALDVTSEVGSVQVGLRKEVVVRATNTGIDAMSVLGVSLGSAGNGSWVVRDLTRMLAPGSSVTATVTFAPPAVGAQTTQVTLSHDADAALSSVRLNGTWS